RKDQVSSGYEKHREVTKSELAEIEIPTRGVVSWRRRGILTRFSPRDTPSGTVQASRGGRPSLRIPYRKVDRTMVWEPGFWLYPTKVCHLYLMDPSTRNDQGKRYTLEEQIELAEREEPSRTQWTAYCTDV
ncbi:hypothetical protein PHPALM_32040, partial [Phytophthora palmivora]